MSIRPIDLQVIVPKALSNPNAREHIVNKEAIQLQQTQMENKRQASVDEKRVNTLTHKKDEKIEEKKDMTQEKGKKKKSIASKKKNIDDTLEQKEDKKPQAKGWNFHRFDMKV